MENKKANVTVRVYESDRDELNERAKETPRAVVADIIHDLLKLKKRKPKGAK